MAVGLAFLDGRAAAADRARRARRRRGVWQPRFWEHTIRDEADFEDHFHYIHYNPVKHGLVSRVQDWPHSSFHAYVSRGLLPLNWVGGEDTLEEVGE